VLTGNATLTLLPSTGVSNAAISMTIVLVQDSTGGRTVTWPSGTLFAGGSTPVLSTSANAIDVLTAVLLASTNSWMVFFSGKGMIT
jgi:hypothetical protein